MTIIDNYNSVTENKDFIDQFEKLYIENFPVEEERERFCDIIDRIKDGVKPTTIMAIETDGDTLIGACITDYYEEGKFVMPVYMVIRPEYRRNGIGKILFEETISYFDHEHVFIEIDDPDKTSESVIDPNIRVGMYGRMGFEKVPIDYRQPPLKGDGEWCSSLMLMHRGKSLTKDILCKFLKVFYNGLGADNTDEFKAIIESVKNSAVSD